MAKLTNRTVQAAHSRDKDYIIFDDQLPGFGLRVMPSGKKSYLIQYRRNRRTRRITFGRFGTMTPTQARSKAIELLAHVGAGKDPSEERREIRLAPILAVVCQRFVEEHVAQHCKASTAREYCRSIDLFILPVLGQANVKEITRSDVAKLHYDLRHIPYQANRTLGVLSKIFNLTEVWGLRPDGSNPCRHVKKYPEETRERFLMTEELARLGETLGKVEADGSETVTAVAAIRLLILTGCRLSEILTLKWEYVRDGAIYLPDSKTGRRMIPIGDAVLEVLATIERLPDNPYVITGRKHGAHLTDLQHPWRRIRKRAGLDDVRIHDLRHSFASRALALGEGLSMIAKLLGHGHISTTSRYAHLADQPIKTSADRISSNLAEIMNHH